IPMLPVPASCAALLLVAMSQLPAPLAGQSTRPSAVEVIRLQMPSNLAEQVLARIPAAEAREIPVGLLELHALELAAKDLSAGDSIRGVERRAERLERARRALVAGGRPSPDAAETVAAELAMKRGADGAMVSTLARSAPAGGSLAVPLLALSSLMDRGLPSDQAIARVEAWIESGPVQAAPHPR